MPKNPHGPALAELRRQEHSRRRGRRGRRGRAALLVVVLAVAVAGWLGVRHLIDSIRMPQCTITAGGMTETFDPEQTGNAALIAAVSMKRGLPPRAATIAITTAYQESKIRNIRFGDRDSLGLFQQRPSQGWGTPSQILDPVYATNAFYDALVKFKGYESADITKIAQWVQRSGFPEAYRDHEGQGRVLASTLTGHSAAGVSCRLDEATTHAAPADVAADLTAQMGVTKVVPGDGVLTVTGSDARQAWAIAHWAVARAETYGITRVTIGKRAWDRGSRKTGWSDGAASQTVTISLR
ncbi:MAG: hypothetical protein L0H25_04730 [Micrococcales bacterium]|nr:hypothetical protein [Micrococcales bacterium]